MARGNFRAGSPGQVGSRIAFAWVFAMALGLLLRADSSAVLGSWLDVPFVRQDRNLCGAASVSMVLQYWQNADPMGSSTDVPAFSHIASALRSSESKGALGSQMKAYLMSLGYQVFMFKGQWEDIESHISKGRPLIVALGNRGTLHHYVVVTGWNDFEDVVLVNDPARRKLLKLDRKHFQTAWEHTSFWTLLALPTGPSPTSPTHDAR
ncbi:MAG: C39 family peptidase [Acidobacteria bacterium]|nr:C39 family peptidase [Acidobacteriota bacterium]